MNELVAFTPSGPLCPIATFEISTKVTNSLSLMQFCAMALPRPTLNLQFPSPSTETLPHADARAAAASVSTRTAFGDENTHQLPPSLLQKQKRARVGGRAKEGGRRRIPNSAKAACPKKRGASMAHRTEGFQPRASESRTAKENRRPFRGLAAAAALPGWFRRRATRL